ncbi:MAG: hypothetical protein JW990_07535, partial [Thermoleophilia bacterium]|nr:hypothetical protein [Thermoleophilia bacterium]
APAPAPAPASAAASDAAGRRVWLRVTQSADRYLSDIERGLAEVETRMPIFDLCLYNAGMDPFEGCSTGGFPGITHEMLDARERLVFAWCRSHARATAFVLAGGYIGWGLAEEGLVDLHRLTLSAAAEKSALDRIS